jgi:hypothetical protein
MSCATARGAPRYQSKSSHEKDERHGRIKEARGLKVDVHVGN